MSKKKKWEINRRDFLKCSLGGAGTLIGLPFLEAMLPSIRRAEAATGTDDIHKRFVAFAWPLGALTNNRNENGFWPSEYRNDPTAKRVLRGNAFSLSYSLKPLEAFKSQLSLFTGICYYNRAGGETHMDHPGAIPRFLTNLRRQANNPNLDDTQMRTLNPAYGGKSMDQVIADYFQSTPEGRTSIHSLQLASTYFASSEGYLTYRKGDQPVRPNNDLIAVFNQLFSGYSAPQASASVTDRTTRKRLVLDHVIDDIRTLRSRLGKNDKIRLDEYLTEIESLQAAVNAAPAPPPVNSCTIPGLPPEIPREPGEGRWILGNRQEEHTTLMIDLMAAAFKCNRTRVISYLQFPEPSMSQIWRSQFEDSYLRTQRGEPNINLLADLRSNYGNDIGNPLAQVLTVDAPSISHRDNKDFPNIEKAVYETAVREIDRRKVSYVAYLAKKLSQIQDGNGKSALENSVVLAGTGLGDPGGHDSDNCATLVLGSAGDRITPNSMHSFGASHGTEYTASISVLHVELMKALGVPININQFGINNNEPLDHPARRISIQLRA